MRSLAKYKLYSQITPNVIPFKLLKFNRSKWKKIKKIIKINLKVLQNCKKFKNPNNLIKRKPSFKNKSKFHYYYGLQVRKRTMPSFSKYYKSCLLTNRVFKQFFNNKFNVEKTTSKEYFMFFKTFLIKQFFNPAVLLTNLNFFNSPSEAVQSLLNGSILINFEKKKSNYVLKAGDLISLSDEKIKSFCFKKIVKKKMFLKRKLFSFLEIDFITGNILILKDPSSLNYLDSNLFINSFIDIHQLKNYKKI